MKKKSKKTNHWVVLRHFSLSFLFVLFVPIVMGVISYHNIIDITTEQTVQSNMLIMENSKNTLENSMNAVGEYADTLTRSALFEKVINQSGREDINLMDILDVIKKFPEYHDAGRLVKSYYFYLNRHKILMAPDQAFLDLKKYYGHYFYFDNMHFADLEQFLEAPLTQKQIVNFQSDDMNLQKMSVRVQLLYQIPVFDKGSYTIPGQLLFVLDEEQIKNSLRPAFDLGAGFVYILNEKNESIIQMGREERDLPWIDSSKFDLPRGMLEEKIENEDMVISYLTLEKYDWIYVIGIPKQHLLSQARNSMGDTIAYTFLLTVLCMLLIFAVYCYNQRPLYKIVNELGLTPTPPCEPDVLAKTRNGLWYLSMNISALVSRKEFLERRIAKQQKQLREAFWIQIVSGDFLGHENLAKRMDEYGICIKEKQFRGVYMVFNSNTSVHLDGERYKEIARESLANKKDTLLPGFWADMTHLTLLHLEPFGQDHLDRECFNKICIHISDTYGVDVVFMIGSPTDELRSVHTSFAEARKLMLNQKASSSDVFFVNEYKKRENTGFHYSSEIEAKLLEYAGMGRIREIEKILRQIYKRNFSDIDISFDMRDLLFARMTGTLVCSIWNEDIHLESFNYNEIPNIEFFGMILSTYRQICEKNVLLLAQKQQELKNTVLEYIDTHYCESDLCLKTLSIQFGITGSYISTLIKQWINENFSTYLEKRRIDFANELLSNPALSISEISARIGYESVTSFGRAYKRVTGYSASEGRKRLL